MRLAYFACGWCGCAALYNFGEHNYGWVLILVVSSLLSPLASEASK